MQSKQIRSSFQKTVFPLIQRFTSIDQLGVTGEGDLLVGVIHHQITAGSPDSHIPSLFATAATTAAQAPVPQASVSPLPRSQTRILMVLGFTTRINSALIRSGK